MRFNKPIDRTSLTKNSFELRTSDAAPVKAEATSAAVDTNDETVVKVDFLNVAPNQYSLFVLPPIKDKDGNEMDTTADKFKFPIIMPVGGNAPILAPGITATTGPYVPFQEYNSPRPEQNGFNPSDKVVSRVVRLYYFRDAHRVAQIVNRKARSYNRAAVDVAAQLADRSRGIADQETDARRALERAAVQAAQDTRAAQHALDAANVALAQAQQSQAQAQGSAASAQSQLSAAQTNSNLQPGDLTMTAAQLQQEVAASAANASTTGSTTSSTSTPSTTSSTPTTLTAQQQAETNLASALSTQSAAQSAVQNATTQLTNAQTAVAGLQQTLQIKRNSEIAANERAQQADAAEERAREDQFRREVALGHSDPDTYAPAVPGSVDPVEQVSISVIGEGVIQLRGPIKGVNIIRTMINDIDAPVGQVRVSIDTVQVNGERGERMEVVVGMIQRYIDHARFLTSQSAEMLRKAVVKVASEKASMTASQCQPRSQQSRDEKYLEAFFGQDFIDELKSIDSEFLKSGNKLLSLHSMDTTSLAAALFLFALAKNTIRQEILQEFMQQVENQLPQDEMEFLQAAGPRERHERRMTLLSQNARFISLRGFFNGEVLGDDTLNPIQREFIQLAQIFKSRLVTELELNQRVMERSMIEDRLGDYISELRAAAAKEKNANTVLAKFQAALRNDQQSLLTGLAPIQAQDTAAEASLVEIRGEIAQLTDILVNQSGDQNNVSPRSFDTKVEWFRQRVSEKHFDLSEIDKLAAVSAEFKDLLYGPNREVKAVPTAESIISIGHEFAKQMNDVWMSASDTDPDKQKFLKGYALYQQTAPVNKGYYRLPAAGGSSVSVIIDTTGKTQFPNGDWSKFQSWLKRAVQDARTRFAAIKDVITQKLGYSGTGDEMQELNRAESELDSLERAPSSQAFNSYSQLCTSLIQARNLVQKIRKRFSDPMAKLNRIIERVNTGRSLRDAYMEWSEVRPVLESLPKPPGGKSAADAIPSIESAFVQALRDSLELDTAELTAVASRRPLDHKKFLDMLTDDVEDKYIELLEGTRAHTANIDAYIKRLATAVDDDFNTQFYEPAFRYVRKASRFKDVELGQIETTSILANNRSFAKVEPQATMEFDLPKRDILINEAFKAAQAAYTDYGALLADPNFLALTKLYSGQPTSSVYNSGVPAPLIQNVLPGLPASSDESLLTQPRTNTPQLGSALEALIPDPAVYKFETGTGFEIRPVIQPDGQSVVFHLNYMYTTNVREPVRADEKHLGRIKRHFIDTDVQLGNYELREVSRYRVALKASRTSRGVPLLEDAPGIGILFRPLPSAESSLQENVILAQSTIFPTLFDLMGLRWAPAVADLDALRLQESEFVTRQRQRALRNRVFDYSSGQVDEYMRIPDAQRRPDLYRSQETIPIQHPNGYNGPGLDQKESHLREGYDPDAQNPETQFTPGESREGVKEGARFSRMPPLETLPPPSGEPLVPRMAPAQPPGLVPVPGLMGPPAQLVPVPTLAPPPTGIPPGTLPDGPAFDSSTPIPSGPPSEFNLVPTSGSDGHASLERSSTPAGARSWNRSIVSPPDGRQGLVRLDERAQAANKAASHTSSSTDPTRWNVANSGRMRLRSWPANRRDTTQTVPIDPPPKEQSAEADPDRPGRVLLK